LFCFGGVRVGQSFVFFNCCFVLVGFVLGNLLFSLIVVLFWWGSCWAIFNQSKTTIKENKRLPNSDTNSTKTKQQLKKTKDCPTRTPPKQNNN
jgi:ABC-type microcin C transport system permease subunit YejB